VPPGSGDQEIRQDARPSQCSARLPAALSITEDSAPPPDPSAASPSPLSPPSAPHLSGWPAPSCPPWPAPEPAPPPSQGRPSIQASPNLHRPNRAYRSPANGPLTCPGQTRHHRSRHGRTRRSEPSRPTARRTNQPDLNSAIPSTFRAKSTPYRRHCARYPGSYPSLSVTVSIGITSKPALRWSTGWTGSHPAAARAHHAGAGV